MAQTQPLKQGKTEAVPSTGPVAVVVQPLEVTGLVVEPVVHGAVIPLEQPIMLEVERVVMAMSAPVENLAAVMEGQVGPVEPQEQAALVGQAEFLAVGAVLAEVPLTLVLVEQVDKESAEYGPGSSEQRRTQRPGCSEA